MSQGPASTYAAITRQVDAMVAEYRGNDRRRVRYMIMRAAVLGQMADGGPKTAFDMCSDLADEVIQTGAPK